MNQWYSNYTEASQRALVHEVGKLCYLVGLMPTRGEKEKGVRMSTGEVIDDEGVRVVLRPRAQESVDLQEVKEEDVEDERLEEEPMDREESSSASGGDKIPAEKTASASTDGGNKFPTKRAGRVSEMHKVLEVDYILEHQLDPIRGPARPYGIRAGWHVFNGPRQLACGWSCPPHIPGGTRVACF